MTDLDRMLVRPDGFVPKERYTTREFTELEHERLWPRVWQIACREEQVARPGDFVEYTIGDETVVDRRAAADGALHAFYNACLHRGRRLADGLRRVRRRRDPLPVSRLVLRARRPARRRSRPRRVRRPARRSRVSHRCGSTRGAGSCSSTSTPTPSRCSTSSIRCPTLLAPYHLEQMRLRASLSTIIDANWKAVVDAFNEGYHVQGLHPQILPWTDDVSIEYEQFDRHAHYGRLPGARRELRPSPRLDLAPDDYDEGEILAEPRRRARRRVPRRGARRGRGAARERTAAGLDAARGVPGSGAWQLLDARGFDVSGLAPELMTSADDVYWFPNVVGPIYPGSAILFRVRPLRHRSRSLDQGHVGARVARARARRRSRRGNRSSSRTGATATGARSPSRTTRTSPTCSAGMRSAGWAGRALNPRQEGNILHMHRVIDRLPAPARGRPMADDDTRSERDSEQTVRIVAASCCSCCSSRSCRQHPQGEGRLRLLRPRDAA